MGKIRLEWILITVMHAPYVTRRILCIAASDSELQQSSCGDCRVCVGMTVSFSTLCPSLKVVGELSDSD